MSLNMSIKVRVLDVLAIILAFDIIQGQDEPVNGPFRCICQLDLRPVCGVDGYDYPNLCTALCQKALVACRQRCPCPPTTNSTDINDESFDFNSTTSTMSTFLNDSSLIEPSANNQNASNDPVIDPPFFAAIEEDSQDGPNCYCEENYEPVCGDDNTTYSNNCQLDCARVNQSCEGECPCGSGSDDEGILLTACRCPDVYEPICGNNGETYQNACYAGCKAVTVDCLGKCPCLKSRSRSRKEGLTSAFD